jgi:glutamine---fructose-6-phosphate transaminase (isomerizing)
METGKFTYEEIVSQPEAWADALSVVRAQKAALIALSAKAYSQVLFTGCGSTYYLSLAAAALFQELTGRLARAVPGGELLFNPQTVLTGGKSLLVAVSRSGATTETVRAVEQFRRDGRGDVVVITNYADKPLARLADLLVVIEKGQEESVAQTRSFASMYVAATALCAVFAGRDDLLEAMSALPEAGQRLIRDIEPVAKKLGEDQSFDRFYFLGSGIRYGLACEVNLKMKEMTLTHSEPFHFLEFRHGPMSMVTKSAVVVGMLSDSNRKNEQKVLSEMAALGGTVVSLGESDALVAFQSQVAEAVRSVLYLPALQLMAYYRSLSKELNPDRPTNLSTVVFLE